MKRIIVLLLFVLANFASARITEVMEGVPQIPQLKIFVDDVNPEPVEPGQDVTLKIRLTNEGGANARDVSVELEVPYPFKLKTQEERLESIKLCAGCSKDNTYYLKVDEGAITGIYPLVFNAFVGNVQIIFDQKVNVHVRGRPELVFATETVDNVIPNTKFRSAVSVRNIGTGKARVITVAPESTAFVVLGSNVRTIDTLLPGTATGVLFEFTTSENTEADVYQIPIMFTYLDETGSRYNQTRMLGARVVDSAEINIESIKIQPAELADVVAREDKPFNIIVRVENIGYGEADFTKLELVSCPVKGATTGFVGHLDKDESSPAVFSVQADSGSHKCKLRISWKDDLGPHELFETFDLQVFPKRTRISILAIIGLLVIIIALIVFYRKR